MYSNGVLYLKDGLRDGGNKLTALKLQWLQFARFMNSTEQYLEAQAAASEQVDVPTMVNYIIQDSLHRGASDIHIEP